MMIFLTVWISSNINLLTTRYTNNSTLKHFAIQQPTFAIDIYANDEMLHNRLPPPQAPFSLFYETLTVIWTPHYPLPPIPPPSPTFPIINLKSWNMKIELFMSSLSRLLRANKKKREKIKHAIKASKAGVREK